MRINITNDPTDIRTGYKNVFTFPINGILAVDYKTLANINGPVEEIIAVNVLQAVHFTEIKNVLTAWVNKLSSKGELYIQTLDGCLTSNIMHYQSGSPADLNKLIFGENPKNPNLGIYNIQVLESLLKELGCQVLAKSFVSATHLGIRVVKQ